MSVRERLQVLKERLAQTLCDKGVDAQGEETLTALVDKAATVSVGEETLFGSTGNLYTRSLTIPAGVRMLSAYCYHYCTQLMQVAFPDSLMTINNNAFTYCSKLASLTLPASLKTIGAEAFAYCSALPSVTLPSLVSSVGTRAFAYCLNMEEASIPSTVQKLETTTFLCNTKLMTITVDRAQDAIEGAPWGATNATVIWTGTN